MNQDTKSLSKIAIALNKAQSVMSGAKKGKNNPFFKSKYADLSSVFESIRETFAENGLSITQTMDVLESGRMVLKTKMLHVSGEFIDSTMMLPDLTDPQKIGSAITYFRRYSLMAIAGIPAEDDDGNSASRSSAPTINTEQIETIEKLINGHHDIREQVLKNCNGDFATITLARFGGALQWIKKLVEAKEMEND